MLNVFVWENFGNWIGLDFDCARYLKQDFSDGSLSCLSGKTD